MYRHIYSKSNITPIRHACFNSSRSVSLINNNKLVSPLLRSNQNENVVAILSVNRTFYIQSGPCLKDPESKVEKTSNLLKDKLIGDESKKRVSAGVKEEQSSQLDVPRPTLYDKIVKEIKHYYNGFKLLFLETRITFRLLKHVLEGNTLTRRERRQFTRTSADLFRLVPFSLFVIIPFMELALPIFLKLFPNMLPSTFSEESKERENMKKKLKAKLEVAKFLQDTLEETAMKGSKIQKPDSLNHKFVDFMNKVRTNATQPTNEEIMKYSSLFENELTLDNLSRQQLIALCQILDVSTLANIPPNHMLRFQLRMKIRSLETDDKMILKEGIDKLDISELQQACRDRGMRAMGLSEIRLRLQLSQWLDLHIKQNIPVSLLLFSRSLYLPENLPTEDLIKSTLSALPKSIENATIAKIAEMSGSKVDNTVKLEILRQEEEQINLENIEHDVEEAKSETIEKKTEPVSPVPSTKPDIIRQVESLDLSDLLKREILTNKAKTFLAEKLDSQELLTPKDIKEMSQILDNLPSSEKSIISDEIKELKKDVDEYIEDVKEVEEMSTESQLTETKSAKILSNRVQKLITDMDVLMADLEEKKPNEELNKQINDSNMVSIEELMGSIRTIRGQSDDTRDTKLQDVLKTLDSDQDGKINDLNDVIKVFDIIEQENVQVTKAQLAKLITLVQKEQVIEFEETLQSLLSKPELIKKEQEKSKKAAST